MPEASGGHLPFWRGNRGISCLTVADVIRNDCLFQSSFHESDFLNYCFSLVNLKFQPTDAAPQLRGPSENAPSTSQGLSLPAPLPQSDTPLDLEQQWQDIMAIMELQVCIFHSFF